jgi:hypothetical protein
MQTMRYYTKLQRKSIFDVNKKLLEAKTKNCLKQKYSQQMPKANLMFCDLHENLRRSKIIIQDQNAQNTSTQKYTVSAAN